MPLLSLTFPFPSRPFPCSTLFCRSSSVVLLRLPAPHPPRLNRLRLQPRPLHNPPLLPPLSLQALNLQRLPPMAPRPPVMETAMARRPAMVQIQSPLALTRPPLPDLVPPDRRHLPDRHPLMAPRVLCPGFPFDLVALPSRLVEMVRLFCPVLNHSYQRRKQAVTPTQMALLLLEDPSLSIRSQSVSLRPGRLPEQRRAQRVSIPIQGTPLRLGPLIMDSPAAHWLP